MFLFYKGVLDLLLSGYDNIPNDDTALVAIPDIGTHAEGTALICRHGLIGIPSENEIDNWNYIPENGQEVRVNSDIGWSVSREQNNGDVRLERIAGVSPLEGTYKCVVDRSSVNNDEGIDSVTVYLYWPCECYFPYSSVYIVLEDLCVHVQACKM